ncbi:MAG TPA: glycogen debranching N-terminal domain-containing protein [Candidatus Dormibacteraeota bacterium]|nr:glycogen debranching N-terminal domain-containing protein [Candidatus Dormibacteraeota bacterium]
MSGRTVSILEGNTFVVSDRGGNINATLTDPEGLFAWDTRFLSKWILTVDGLTPNVLSTDDLRYYETQFFLVPGTGTIYVDADLSIIRTRAVGEGFSEDIVIRNESNEPKEMKVKLEAAADFADLFEVKDAQPKKGQLYQTVKDSRLTLGYKRGTFNRETFITSTASALFEKDGLTFNIRIEPHSEWKTRVDVEISLGRLIERPVNGDRPQRGKDLTQWLKGAPSLRSEWEPMARIYTKSLVDLAALRFRARAVDEGALPAAGLPWFMSIFGRDSILTSFQALPFVPDLARSTLQALARWQGTRVDPFRDEEPGKILHELRYGELTAFEERPHSPYYGAADSTPLFIVLLDEYSRWTGDRQIVRDLEVEARAALNWIEQYGDHNGDGYIDYKRAMDTGLDNQCWKDSWNSILFADGTNSILPRSTCEIQGYAYDARVRGARMAREIWHDPDLASSLEQSAIALKDRFNRDFWLPERGCYALAIDGNGRRVDSITSNIGHLLWSGIVPEDRAARCAELLMSDALFSGWGVRTMAEGEGGYNPIGYHLGTVWPHDNSIIAWGLTRYGFRKEAARIAAGILQAALFFNGRLPEAFAGYRRQMTRFPVEYPTACSPQAWATGAPLLMLRAIMGMEPVDGRLLVDAKLPIGAGWVEILDIPGAWGRADAYGRGTIEVDIQALDATVVGSVRSTSAAAPSTAPGRAS